MRHRTDHPRASARVVAALAATTALLVALTAPAFAQDTPPPPDTPGLVASGGCLLIRGLMTCPGSNTGTGY